MRFDTLLTMADKVQTYKYVVRNDGQEARQGRDLHAEADLCRQRLRHARPPVDLEGRQEPHVRSPNGYAGIERDRASYYIGGLLKHGPALLALAAPTVNSLSPPGSRVRSAGQPGLLAAEPLGRGPHPDLLQQPRRASASSSAARTPPRTRTCSSRALLMAGLDGVKNKIDPGDAGRVRPLRGRQGQLAKIKSRAGLAPRSARRARGRSRLPARRRGLHARASSTPGSTTSWTNEVEPVNLRITPYEFYLYFDV